MHNRLLAAVLPSWPPEFHGGEQALSGASRYVCQASGGLADKGARFRDHQRWEWRIWGSDASMLQKPTEILPFLSDDSSQTSAPPGHGIHPVLVEAPEFKSECGAKLLDGSCSHQIFRQTWNSL